MEIKNLKETDVRLLGRKRISFELEHNAAATPKKQALKEEIAKKYKIKEELVAIRHVYSKFGVSKAKVIAHIYEDEKNLKFLETPKGKKEKASAEAKK